MLYRLLFVKRNLEEKSEQGVRYQLGTQIKTKITEGERQTLHSSVPSARMKKSDDSP